MPPREALSEGGFMSESRTVMIVEHDREVAELIARGLREEGYRPKVAHRAERALDRLQRGDVHLVIVDRHLEQPDGFTMIEALRDLRAPICETPVLLTSELRLDADTKERARKLRVKAVLRRPTALERLTKAIEKYAKEPPPKVHESAPTDSHERYDGPLSGKLRDLPLPELLHHIHGLRASGVLMLENGKKKKAVQMRDGYPVAVKSNLITETLGHQLVRRGLITQEHYDESLARTKSGEGMQGEILVAMEVLEEEQVAEAVASQNDEKLFEIFGWKGGSFRFEIGSRLKRGCALAGHRSPASVILEGVRTRYPMGRIDHYLAAHAQRWVGHTGNSFNRLQMTNPRAELMDILERTKLGCRIGDLCADDEPGRRALYGLIIVGMLDVRAKRPGGAAGADESAVMLVDDVSTHQSKTERERTLRAELAATAESLRGQTYFEMLGISESATPEQVHEAFERQARQAHPDRYAHASKAVRQLADDVFQQLSRACETLMDPKRRAHYMSDLRRGERKAAEAAADRKILDAEVEFQRGESLLRQRSYQAALLCFGNALQKAPDEGEYHAHYGWCLHLSHPEDKYMRDEAIEHVRRGIKLARDHDKPYLYLGRLYKSAGREPAAEKMFNRAIQLRPDSVEALRELRLLNMRREKSKGLIGRLLGR